MNEKDGQVWMSDPDLWCGKTCPEHFPQTEERISELSFKKSSGLKIKRFLYLDLRKENGGEQGLSWETDFPLDGGYLTPNTGEFPSEENESHLSQILQEAAPDRYYLTAKACMGIIERAKRRGKELPPALREALEEQINCSQRNPTENTL